MTDDVTHKTQAGARASPFGVSEKLAAKDTGPIINLAFRLLIPDGSSAALRALFDGRYPYHAIYDWRRGRASPPQWALERIADRLAVYSELERRVRTVKPRRRGEFNRGLLLWHAQRRAQKLARQANEKASD